MFAVFPSHLIEALPANTNHAVKAQHQVRMGASLRQEAQHIASLLDETPGNKA